MLVKVCGIKTIEEARLCIDCGANALGFNFYRKSPRYLPPAEAARILIALPPSVLKVAVVVGADISQLPEGLDAVQLHGLQEERELPPTSLRLFLALRPDQAHLFPGHEIIIDSSWGQGKRADWNSLQRLDRPFILSGGLNAENVGSAIRRMKPVGVDVCSGVESAPGRKDPGKIRAFLQAVGRERPIFTVQQGW